MPRNGSGTFSVSYTYSAGETFTAAKLNASLADLSAGITASLALDGQSTMTGAIKGAAGSAAAPGYSFGAEPNLGFYRPGTGVVGFSSGGVLSVQFDSNGLTIPAGKMLTATAAIAGAALTDASVALGKLAAQADGTVLANVSGASAAPAAVTGSALLDALIGATPGLVPQRGASAWAGAQILPAGVVMPYGGAAAPAGWLECNGAAVSRTTYAALFTALGTAFGAGDGSTTFNVPDLRGEFIRGWDNGRGIDTGRARGSAQADAFQGHRHNLKQAVNVSAAAGTPGIATAGADSGSYVTDPITDGTNGTPRTASETRPRNVAMMYIVKA